MRRILYFGLLAVLLISLPATHLALARDSKATLCHVSSATGSFSVPGHSISFGRLVEVSRNAVSGHLSHGDGVVGGHEPEVLVFGVNVPSREFFEGLWGISINKNSECFVAGHASN